MNKNSNKNKNNNKRENPKTNANMLTLYLQASFSILTIIFIIVYFISKDTVALLQLSLSFTLLLTGYNNYKTYHRKNVTILYFGIGIIILILAIISIMGI